MLTEIPEVKYIRYMRSHNSGNIHGENVHIWAVERKNHFSKTKIYFDTKTYTKIISTYWATKYESRSETEFWETRQNISNLFDGCWHQLKYILTQKLHHNYKHALGYKIWK